MCMCLCMGNMAAEQEETRYSCSLMRCPSVTTVCSQPLWTHWRTNTWPHTRQQTRNECVCVYVCVCDMSSDFTYPAFNCVTSFPLCVRVCVCVYTDHRVTIWSFLMQASFQILSVWSHTAGGPSSIPRLACMCACVCVCVSVCAVLSHQLHPPLGSFAVPMW